MLAAEKNASAAAKLLIEAGADLDAKDEVRPVGGPGRAVSISAACMHCRHDCVRRLDGRR